MFSPTRRAQPPNVRQSQLLVTTVHTDVRYSVRRVTANPAGTHRAEIPLCHSMWTPECQACTLSSGLD
ncbi:hypothetical protein RRG08_016342 [Elysia crispata]|uniref:Uncharacterized protein n=1 Tax=Elysia crispata TaxID=231223 RepID=A0AAE0YG25_9GAST|nr:hypothetical protein RRG08_016342 [Elysia crispata]